MSFEVTAEAYDRYMGAWSQRLAPRMIELAGIEAGARVLDVGCGTGMLTRELVSRLGPERVVAVDPSESFVAALRSRLPDIEVRQANAERLPFADGTFDAALAQLVVHFMADPVVGLTEMARVTRRDGSVAACVWDYAGDRGPLGPFWRAARELDDEVEDEAQLPGTRAGNLAELLAAAGLREVEEGALVAERSYASFDAWWEPFTKGVGPGGAYVRRLSEPRRTALRERCRVMLPDPPFRLVATAWAARGVV